MEPVLDFYFSNRIKKPAGRNFLQRVYSFNPALKLHQPFN